MGRLTVRVGGALLAGLVLLSAPATLAMPRYRLIAAHQLGYDKDDPLWQLSGKVMPCTTCHVRSQGGPPWNAFGESLRAGFRAHPNARFADVLYSVLQANADADGDGYPDALEFYAHTLPGDPASHPQKPLAELQAEFERAGGMQQYAPKK
ncbi:hypothetical protein E5F05_20815 [Deinococcus metallilatus]|uniref:Uncharacterized protein n=2 Tax=Deinococcus TaxID=1298 RepID=A0AAJ5JZ56_9DEIO|nr:hypothetical protein [Deinococcus metallilatus]MBB5294416.1 hypothetical protein [Deinococcus metallilatus]QBY10167.1 hypothetical protein E5F05_20815 [Deinococcus metallilatus]RXJ13893.1 hypothetical protein ERJ73_04465 [Deinococcus metallilatus]TLK29859.1 hypothetical protein FCS05_04780 [Deinococcus metallilatus]GMA15632.1 hypothetical protein GCM10025871_19630 [Deinococcus metallilatus]